MLDSLVVIRSADPFLLGKQHDPSMVQPLVGLVVRCTPHQPPGVQGELFGGNSPPRGCYSIPVEALLEALDSLTGGHIFLNYWMNFWCLESKIEFTVHLGQVRERLFSELFDD